MRQLVLTVVVLGLALGEPVRAQMPNESERWASTSWVDDFTFASANVVLGALIGGISSHLRDGSFSRGFSRGALGGGVWYLGKRVSATHFGGAGIVGRQIGAVGGSMVRNASSDIGLLDALVVPVGPLRVHVSPHALTQTTLQLDLQEAAWVAKALADDRLDLDWGRTLSAGAPVFVTSSALEDRANGVTNGGVILLSRRSSSDLVDVLAHESVHVAQVDLLKVSIGYPLESWVRGKAGLGDLPLDDHVVAGIVHGLFQYALSGAWERSRDLLEVEAEFLEAR